MIWTGFMLVKKVENEHRAYLSTARGCALQSFQAGIDQGLFKDSHDAARKLIEIAYVQIERKDK